MIEKLAIEQHLEKILKSPSFMASSLLSKFLRYVVEQSQEGNQQSIKAYNIAVDAFGRSSDFDPQKDTIVRIYAGKLRKELAVYYADVGKSDAIRISIPKGSYQPRFEIVNDEITKEDKPLKKPISLKRKYVLGSILLILFVTILVFKLLPETKTINNKPVIVFFEIKNLNTNAVDNIWANGITEEIAILSSRFSEIEIYGPLSNEDKTLDLSNFSKNDYLFAFNGNFNKTDSLFILNTRLTDYRTGKLLWAKSYKKVINGESLMEIEYEVCNDISKKIGNIYGVVQSQILSNPSQSHPTNLSSHKSILQYYKYLKDLSYDEFLLTKELLTQTVKNDPNYGIAWSALGALYVDEYLHFDGDSLESFTKGHQYINRALLLDSENVLVQNNRVYIAFMSKQMVEFEQAINKVQELNPTNIMNGENGLYLVYLGESERGLNMIKQAQEYAIDYPGYFHVGPFLDYYRKGKFKKALIEANKINMPNGMADHLCRFLALVNLNQLEEARKEKKEVLKIIPDFDTNGATILSNILLKKDIDAIINDWEKVEIDE